MSTMLEDAQKLINNQCINCKSKLNNIEALIEYWLLQNNQNNYEKNIIIYSNEKKYANDVPKLTGKYCKKCKKIYNVKLEIEKL